MSESRNAFGSFVLDSSTGSVLHNGVPIFVGRRSFAILQALLEAHGRVVAKDELIERAWPDTIVGEANLSVQIAALRKALAQRDGSCEWITTVPRVGYRLIDSAPIQNGKSTLAVLPFSDLGLGSQDYFADGIVEDITTALSRFSTFAVISRSAAFAFRDHPDPRVAARLLGVRYVLTGSLRRRADRLRVTVQLLDGESGQQRWAEQFDGSTEELFAFHDRLIESVAGLVEPGIRKAEIDRVRRKPPQSLDAYELYLRALPHFRGTAQEDRREAIHLLEEAAHRDSDFALGLAHAAWAYERQDTFGSGLSDIERARALQLAELALSKDPDDPLVQAICALVLLNVALERDRSLAMLSHAETACPHNATVLSLYAFANVMVGDVEAGREAYLRALRIAPGAFDNYELYVGVAIAELFKGEFDEAVSWSLRSIAQNGGWLGAYWMLTAAYVQLDRIEDARRTVERLLARAPAMRVADLERLGQRYAHRFQTVVDSARRAGLPD